MADDYPPVLDTTAVADLLDMNVDTVRRLSRERILPAHRVPGGRTFKYLKDEVLAWLAEQPAHNPPVEDQADDQADDQATGREDAS